MATKTTNLGLDKPDATDAPDIAIINGNMDKIDSEMGNMAYVEVGIDIDE